MRPGIKVDEWFTPDLKDALGEAIQESQNTTKAPKTDLLKDNLLEVNNNETKVPKSPKDLGGLNDLPTLSPGE